MHDRTPRKVRRIVARLALITVCAAGASGTPAAAWLARAEATAQPEPGAARALIRAVKEARIFDLSHLWDEHAPIASVNPPFQMALDATHAGTRGTFGDGGQLSFASEVMHWSGQHGAPSIDAIGHIGRDGLLFGGVDAAASTDDPAGIGRSGVGAHLAIDAYPLDLLVNRGVLLDVARLIMGDLTPLDPGFEVTARHLLDAAAAQGVTLERGDTVFVRTGWGRHFRDDPALYGGPVSPGLGLDGAELLVARGARVVGNDTLTFEKRPPIVLDPVFQVFPVHMRLIADEGIYIIENLNLEELAAARVYEFLVVVPPLKVRGGTGSALRVFAVAPAVPVGPADGSGSRGVSARPVGQGG